MSVLPAGRKHYPARHAVASAMPSSRATHAASTDRRRQKKVEDEAVARKPMVRNDAKG
jgi:hypothetical protein